MDVALVRVREQKRSHMHTRTDRKAEEKRLNETESRKTGDRRKKKLNQVVANARMPRAVGFF